MRVPRQPSFIFSKQQETPGFEVLQRRSLCYHIIVLHLSRKIVLPYQTSVSSSKNSYLVSFFDVSAF